MANNSFKLKELSSAKDSAAANEERISAEISTVSHWHTYMPFFSINVF